MTARRARRGRPAKNAAAPRVVHAERNGVALCDHRIKVADDGREVTCKRCLQWVPKPTLKAACSCGPEGLELCLVHPPLGLTHAHDFDGFSFGGAW